MSSLKSHYYSDSCFPHRSEGNIISMNPNFFHSKHLMTVLEMPTSCLSTCWRRWITCHKITHTVLKTFNIFILAATHHGLSFFTWHLRDGQCFISWSVAAGNPLVVIMSRNKYCALSTCSISEHVHNLEDWLSFACHGIIPIFLIRFLMQGCGPLACYGHNWRLRRNPSWQRHKQVMMMYLSSTVGQCGTWQSVAHGHVMSRFLQSSNNRFKL